jgi:pantetheine-phosphate adenylyltransferase
VSRLAIYAGTFDPITRGHEDIMVRALDYVDQLVVGVAPSSNKQPIFNADERVALIEQAVAGHARISVQRFDGLLVDFARALGAKLLIRGLRAMSDFEYEYQMALMNRHLYPQLETVYMIPSLETTFISATMVREVARFGGNLEGLVNPTVADALRAKFPAPAR